VAFVYSSLAIVGADFVVFKFMWPIGFMDFSCHGAGRRKNVNYLQFSSMRLRVRVPRLKNCLGRLELKGPNKAGLVFTWRNQPKKRGGPAFFGQAVMLINGNLML